MALRRALRVVARASLLSAAAGGAYVGVDPQRREAAAGAADASARFVRASYHGAAIILDYRTLDEVEEAHGKRSEEYKAAKSRVDLASARRLLELCKRHGGMYVKAAQYLSTLNHVLPPEYTTTLSEAQDRACSRPWAEVARVFREETGRDPGDVFASIGEQPIAAASLAQVHRAVTREGAEVAVKIQYPGLGRQVASDMAALKLFLGVIETLYPQHGYSWLWPEFASSAAQELDFLQEASNGERVAAMFAGRRHVHIPTVVRPLSTRRVLVMEFIHGVRVTDREGLRRLGVAPRDVAGEVSRFFGDQIHTHGLVHCDPHAGNLLVRRVPDPATGRPTGHWQLVVLDHGMYRRVSPSFRAAYCRLWKALITRDGRLGETAAVELGLDPAAYDGLSLLLTFRSSSSSAALGSRMSAGDIARLKRDYSAVDGADVNRFMQRLPRDMLFVLRASNMVRALNKDLGGSSRQRFRVMGECAIRGLVLTDAVEDFSDTARAFLQQQQLKMKQQQQQQRRPASPNNSEPSRGSIAPLESSSTSQGGPVSSAGAVSQPSSSTTSSSSPPPPPSSSTTGVSAEKPASGAKGLLRLARDVLSNLGREPPVEPLTYLNALSTRALITESTESEAMAAAAREVAAAGGLLGGVMAAVSPTRAVRKARAELGILGLWLRLWQLDVTLAILTAVGSFTPYADPDRPHREAG